MYTEVSAHKEKREVLTKTTMQEIQDLKLHGLTQAEIASYYVNHGKEPPSQPTIAKHYAMDAVPEKPGEKLATCIPG